MEGKMPNQDRTAPLCICMIPLRGSPRTALPVQKLP